MNRKLAEKTASIVIQSNFILDSFLLVLKENLEPDEFKEYCRKFGKTMGEAYFEVLAPLWKEHPDLNAEKTGGTYKTNDLHYKNIYDLVLSQANSLDSE